MPPPAAFRLATLRATGPDERTASSCCWRSGFLIKAGAVGVHVWLPGAYAEADDDVSALLSAVVSKVAIFGLLVGTYLAIRSEVSARSRACARLDRHADHARRRHAGACARTT